MKSIIVKTLLVISTALLTSCAMLRGYMKEGMNGPDIFSFETCEYDTIAKGGQSFTFPVAKKQAEWVDTLHFYNYPPNCVNMTFTEAVAPKSKTQGVLIIHNDSIVYERYWGDFSAERMATIFSVSKSITSLLCGIAVDDGYIESIDDPVTKYLPELKGRDPRWERLTIRHLLDMRSGLDFEEDYNFSVKDMKNLNAMARLNYGHNLMKQIRNMKFRREPGTEEHYDSMTSAILGVVIERASGKRYADYLSEKVWQPLQMESVAFVNIDSRKHDVAHAFGGITLIIKDLAKIGRLYLNKGMWEGQRIVSEEWIIQSTKYDLRNNGYHFNWYNLSYNGFPKAKYPGYFALGLYGQVLYVNPYKNLIIVRIGNGNRGCAYLPALFEKLSNVWIE
jgi:CubicO group peptidase (beta-lactamase class C family)